jgi:hypothetical protein
LLFTYLHARSLCCPNEKQLRFHNHFRNSSEGTNNGINAFGSPVHCSDVIGALQRLETFKPASNIFREIIDIAG